MFHLVPTISGAYARRHKEEEKLQAWVLVEDVQRGLDFLKKATDAEEKQFAEDAKGKAKSF